MEILTRAQKVPPIEELEPVVSLEELRELQLHVREVYVEDMIKEYIVILANQTREHPSVYLGASPKCIDCIDEGFASIGLYFWTGFCYS